MKIRNAKESDLNDLAPLACLVNKMHAEVYPDIYQRISVESAKKLLSSKVNDRHVIFRLAENDSQGVGYYFAELRVIEETELFKAFEYIYLAEIVVSPDFRKAGIGQALLEDIKKIAHEKNIDRIDLDVSGFNANARTFFKSQGFDLLRERMTLT